ncbi:MAG: 3-deoxy-manno-octulosonate cytidylyltransferase [Burkholderiales bacterium]|nr:MAG: 3-deoxy-manno-octulosonate cytidylyltransferase [Burkholderiales bacterium]
MSAQPEPKGFVVLIPARLASTRLPDKPLADIAGLPMVVRVARQAQLSDAHLCVVAADDMRIVEACEAHGVKAILTRKDHVSGSDRLAEACAVLGLPDDDVVVNVQGDEPLMDPELINSVAAQLLSRTDCVMSTAAHAIDGMADFLNPNVVKVVLDHQQTALYFSRAPIPWWRDGMAADGRAALPSPAPLRHVGIYAYRVGFLKRFPALEPAPLETTESLEQLRVLWHGERIAVHMSAVAPGAGVDTPQDLDRVRRLLSQG